MRSARLVCRFRRSDYGTYWPTMRAKPLGQRLHRKRRRNPQLSAPPSTPRTVLSDLVALAFSLAVFSRSAADIGHWAQTRLPSAPAPLRHRPMAPLVLRFKSGRRRERATTGVIQAADWIETPGDECGAHRHSRSRRARPALSPRSRASLTRTRATPHYGHGPEGSLSALQVPPQQRGVGRAQDPLHTVMQPVPRGHKSHPSVHESQTCVHAFE
jgi:hypothetical protein